MLYSPEVTGSVKVLLELLPAIKEIAHRRDSIFYRLELLVDKAEPAAERWRAGLHYGRFTKSFEAVQPADRQVITLEREDRLFAQMKEKGRYNIRLAEKNGVLVREATAKSLAGDVAVFYGLYRQTAKREKFSIRGVSYFDELATALYRHNCGRVFIAELEDEPAAAAIATVYQGLASYLYGASSREHKEAMAPYSLHWAIMQWAMSQSADRYDLLAISPAGVKRHPFDGMTRFKEQFGGESVRLMGGYDLVFQPAWYTAFKFAEKVRR